jgi:hypothetical protein
MFATGSAYCNAYRGIRGGMQVGDQLSFYWAINWDAVSGAKGFDLRNGGTNIFNVNNGGTATITTSNGTAFTAFGTTPMLVTLTRTSSTAYSFTMTARDGGAAYSTTINNAATIDGINFYIGNQNDANGNRNMYLNAFQLLKPRYRTTASGNWGDAVNWQISTDGGTTWPAASSAPSGTFDAITIRNGHSITLNTSVSASSLTIDAGGTFNNGTAQTLTITSCNGTITNNGTFNRNTGTVTFSSTGTVIGPVSFHNLNIFGGLTLGAGLNQSTINGTFTINAGGFIASAPPKYISGSTLAYNTSSTFARGNEWPSGNTPETVPHHVIVRAGTTLNLDINPGPTGDNSHYDGEGRTLLGDLDLFGTLTMGGNSGTMAEDLNVGRHVTIRSTGSLTLGSQKPSDIKIADIILEGNWVHENGGVFDPSRRAVIFFGSSMTEQTVTYNHPTNPEVFAYFVINKSNNGTVKMFCNSRVYGTNQGSLFQILNGNLDLNGTSMTLETFDVINNVNQNILIDNNTRNIINTSSTAATFRITHTNTTAQRITTVVRNSANASLLSFGTNIVVELEGSSNQNMGVDFGNAITTINGTLRINPRSFVRDNPPTYAINSLLQYNTGGVYNRTAEWNAASGPGYPFNVQLSTNNTRLIAGGAALSGASANTATALNMAGSLTIDASTTFDMTNANNHDMTVPLTVGLDINNAGTLLASQAGGGNIILGRNWSRTGAGIFTPYLRSVTFNTSRDATLTAPGAGEIFYDLIVNKTGAGIQGDASTPFVGYRVTLNSPVAVTNNLNLTSGYFISTSTNLMTINSGGSATGGAVESFVSGPLRKLGNAPFTFAIGKITNSGAIEQFHYRPIAINNLGASADYTAQFFRVNPYTQGTISPLALAAGLQLISICEYWDLTRASGTNTITVTPSWSTHPIWSSSCNAINYVLNSSALRVVPFNGTNPLPGSSQWGNADFGQSAVGSGNQSYIQTVSWDGALNYNKFVLGSINWQLAPLPFELKNFKAVGKDKDVQLTWLVNNNNQVNHYTIERSRDGVSFETFKKVYARSSEETASYSDLDPTPYTGWAYYRLRIADMSGQVQYSAVQKVWIGSNQTTILVTPKPAKNMLWVNLSKPEEVTELSIVSSVGQLILKQNRIQSNNQIDISRLQPGVYYIRLVGKSGIVTEAFVKE